MGLRIIYGDSFCGFENSLLSADMLKPTEQLAKMTERFAGRSASLANFSHWFQPAAKKTTNTRNGVASRSWLCLAGKSHGKKTVNVLNKTANVIN